MHQNSSLANLPINLETQAQLQNCETGMVLPEIEECSNALVSDKKLSFHREMTYFLFHSTLVIHDLFNSIQNNAI